MCLLKGFSNFPIANYWEVAFLLKIFNKKS